MADNSKIIFQIKADTSDLVKGVRGVNGEVQKVSKSVKGFTEGITSGFAKFGLAVQGVQMGLQMLGSLTRPFTEFQKGMAEVNTLLGKSGPQIGELSDAVVELSKRLPDSADQLASGLYQVISASIDASKSIEFLEMASRGAVAGVTDTKTAVDGITTVLNAYGMEAEEGSRISDIMFTTVKRGKTTFAELSQNLGMVVPVASKMGVSFEELAGTFATLTKAGLNTAMSSTALSGAITELSNPASKINKVLEEMTGKTGGQIIASDGLMGAMLKLSDVSEEVLLENFGRQGVRAILNLAKNFEVATDDVKAMGNSLGATDEAFRKMSATVSFQADVLKNNFNAILIEIGQITLPAINTALDLFLSILENLDKILPGIIGYVVSYRIAVYGLNTGILLAIKNTKMWRIVMVAMNRGIVTTIRSMKLLKASLISSGVGALVVGLGFLIEYLIGTDKEIAEVNKDLEDTGDLVDGLANSMDKLPAPETDLNKVKMEVQAIREKMAINKKLIDQDSELSGGRADNLVRVKELAKEMAKLDRKSEEYKELGKEHAQLITENLQNRVVDIELTKKQQKELEKELQTKLRRIEALEKSGVISKEELKNREKLAEMEAKAGGLKKELAYWTVRLNELGEDDALLTTKQKIEKAKLKAEIKALTEAIEDQSDAEERNHENKLRILNSQRQQEEQFALMQHEAGTKKFKDYWNFLEVRKTQIAEEIEDEQQRAIMINDINQQQENLAFERFGRLRLGFKEFLKGELIDFITAKQIELIGTLAKIWATGGATLGTSLAVSLPLYGVGIGLLEVAKQKVQAFAQGGLVEKATLGLVGEAGPEVIAPQKGFQEYATKELTPMIMSEIQLGNVGQGPDMAQMEKSLSELVDIVKGGSGRTVLRGSDIVIAENRFKRGRM